MSDTYSAIQLSTPLVCSRQIGRQTNWNFQIFSKKKSLNSISSLHQKEHFGTRMNIPPFLSLRYQFVTICQFGKITF